MATYPTYNYETESSDIARRQKVADAMLSGSLSPIAMPQQTGPVASKVSPLTILAKMLEAKFAGDSSAALKKEKSELAERYQADLSGGMRDYQKTAMGYEAPSFPGEGAPMESVPGDKQKAILDAIASNHPVLQAFGMKQMEELGKGNLTAKDLSALATPASVLANPNAPNTWTPQRKLTGQTPGQVMIDEAGNVAEPTPMAPGQSAYGPQGWAEKIVDGDRYAVTATGPRKLDNAPKVNVSTTVNPAFYGQKAGAEAYFKSAATQVEAMGKTAYQATSDRQSLAELRNLDAQGVFSNATSGPATFMTNLAQVAGVKVSPEQLTKLGNTETMKGINTQLWQGLVNKFGGNKGVTKEEAEEIKKMLPQASASPQARRQLFAVLDRVAERQITQYNNANKAFAEAVQKDDPNIWAQKFGEVYLAEPTAPNPAMPSTIPPKTVKWGDLP